MYLFFLTLYNIFVMMASSASSIGLKEALKVLNPTTMVADALAAKIYICTCKAGGWNRIAVGSMDNKSKV